MNNKNSKVDNYLINGCMRCNLGATPKCKVNFWQKELKLLREIILDCQLTEQLKWGVPCYTVNGKNILMIAAFKQFCTISFFKGVLLKDTNNVLHKQGKHTQSARVIKFTSIKEIQNVVLILKAYIKEAIEIEKAGLKVEFTKKPEPIPEEFQEKMNENKQLKDAFYSLTPGRQRGYIIYFSQPKQSKTRFSRIEKCINNIIKGVGLNDKYN